MHSNRSSVASNVGKFFCQLAAVLIEKSPRNTLIFAKYTCFNVVCFFVFVVKIKMSLFQIWNLEQIGFNKFTIVKQFHPLKIIDWKKCTFKKNN